MSTESDAARGTLRSWRRRRDAVASERDPLVIAALKSGLTKEEVHVLTGLGRTTIDRIAVRAGWRGGSTSAFVSRAE
jgi:hypothetical protein